jgi:predicted glycoside hydrolase/deacetylase ChbG (UPF0249 family)
VAEQRYLIVTADDYGIGPAVSRGILDLAARGVVTGTVLLVNSPHAEPAVRAWRQAGAALDMGWHPCLTLDRPVLSAGQVPSLVGPDGRFHGLGRFTRRWLVGRIRAAEVRAELQAQYERFCDLVGRPPVVVNSHHHVQIFSPVGHALLEILGRRSPLPYVRRVREPWPMLARVPGARIKRAFLNALGRRDARRQSGLGFPGNGWLAGVTDPPHLANPDFLANWLTRIPGRMVELTCHPGYADDTLIGRDCASRDGQYERRAREYHLLRDARFLEACRQAGFVLVAPSALVKMDSSRHHHAA